MFTDKKNVLELISLLKAHSIEHAVLCPGSRDIPIVQGISQFSDISCYSITDERSAGFFALGIILSLKKPCAVIVTSGSALLNLHPAVAEAFYRQLPLLIISADRSAAWIGQMDGQTVHQTDVFHSLVKYSGTLNEIKDDTDKWMCNRVCNEALLALTERPFAPVHLNVPIGDPFFSFKENCLPAVRVINRLLLSDLDKVIFKHRKIMLVLGQNDIDYRLSESEKEALAQRFTVYCEHIGNAHCAKFIYAGDGIFQSITNHNTNLHPDLVISLGGHIVSKQLKQFIRKIECTHIAINDDGKIYDVFTQLRYVIKASFQDAINYLCRIDNIKNDLHASKFAFSLDPKKTVIPYSQIGITKSVLTKLDFPCCLHLANSSTVRYASYFKLPPFISVYSNRGVNGIEGSLSAAVGAACAIPDLLHFILIGDLSFFYDMNALCNVQLKQNLRIILFNNSGGEIFAAIPGITLDERSSKFVTAEHQAKGRLWAQECGFKTYEVTDNDGFLKIFDEFIRNDNTNKFMEVITDKTKDIDALKIFKAQLKLKANLD